MVGRGTRTFDQGTKTIGEFLRDLAAALKSRPLDWKLIDAFARLQEREEEANDDTLSDVRDLGRSRIEGPIRRSANRPS